MRETWEASFCLNAARSAMSSKQTPDDEAQEQQTEEEPLGEREVATFTVVPPDGGWGWVIVIASFFCNLVVDGIIFAFGMFLVDIGQAFQESKARVAIVGSLMTGFYLMVGPFVSALANRYGFRTVCILGSVLGCVGFLLSFIAPTLNMLYLTYGVLGGIGFGLVYVPAVIAVGFYFERWRALATGIAVCGSGIGTFVMAPFATHLIKGYGWRGALLIQGAFVLQCAVFGALFRPLEPIKVAVKPTTEDEDGQKKEELPLLLRIKMARDDQLRKCESIASFAESVTGAGSVGPKSRFLKTSNNNMYPTAAQALSTTALASRRMSNASLHGGTARMFGTTGNVATLQSKAQKRLSVPSFPENLSSHAQQTAPAPMAQQEQVMDEEEMKKGGATFTELLKPVQEEHNTNAELCNGNATEETVPLSGVRKRRQRTTSESSTRSKEVGVRPLYRDDIFYSASLLRLPQYTSQMSSVGYHMSVTRLPTKTDVEEEVSSECKICPEAVRRTLSTMLDLSLLRSPTFLLLSVSGFFTMMGFYAPFMYLTNRAELNGMDPGLAIWLVSVIGITNTIGRVVCGAISSFPGMDALIINNVALTIGGVSTILSGVSMSSEYQFFYASVFGLSMACFASLRSILIVDLMGLDKLTNAFGLLLLFQGIAATIGAPLAGSFMDATGSYDATFYLSGSLILVSAILCYPLKRLNMWETSRENNQRAAAV